MNTIPHVGFQKKKKKKSTRSPNPDKMGDIQTHTTEARTQKPARGRNRLRADAFPLGQKKIPVRKASEVTSSKPSGKGSLPSFHRSHSLLFKRRWRLLVEDADARSRARWQQQLLVLGSDSEFIRGQDRDVTQAMGICGWGRLGHTNR